MGNIPTARLRFFTFLISTLLIITVGIFSIQGFLFWSTVFSDSLTNEKVDLDFKGLTSKKQLNSIWVISLLWTLTAMLVIYFLHMRHVLNKFFCNSLHEEKRKINLLFMTFLVAYTLRACISIFYRYY